MEQGDLDIMLHISDFISLMNQEFQIDFTREIRLSATLVDAKEIKSYSPADRKPFSIIFRTQQRNEYFPQAIRIVHHPEKGALPIFMVPLGPDSKGMRYEAIFS